MFSDVSFDVRAGEILGIAGLVGSRRTEVAETIFGLTARDVRRHPHRRRAVDIDSPAAAIDRGMAFLTEDRKMSGLFLPLSVHENMEVTVLGGEFVDERLRQAGELLAACGRRPTPCA